MCITLTDTLTHKKPRILQPVIIKSSNRQIIKSPPPHNLLTRDGQQPGEIRRIALEQVAAYDHIEMIHDLATTAKKNGDFFEVTTQSGNIYQSRQLILATGIRDILPNIPGLRECWAISVVHCPYCHGYEFRDQPTGILANGEEAFHYAQLLTPLSKQIKVFTNGSATFTNEQRALLHANNIPVNETPVTALNHSNGHISSIELADGNSVPLTALYTRPRMEQSSNIPEQLGCAFTEQGYIQIDVMQATTVPGVYACGDNSNPMRSLAAAIASGNIAGAVCNRGNASRKFQEML